MRNNIKNGWVATAFCVLAGSQAWAGPVQVGTATASSVQKNNPEAVARNAVDGNPATRWSSEFADDQWLMLDLGTAQDFVGLELSWEAARAKTYDVLISDDGKTWRLLCTVPDGEGTTDEVYLGRNRSRYIKLHFRERATSWGYSLWEVKVKNPDEEIRVSASSSLPGSGPERALDSQSDTEWHSAGKDPAWLMLELPKPQSLGGMTVVWGADRARAFRIETSADGKSWTLADEEARRTGETDDCYFNAWDVRYVRITCLENSGRGFSIREIKRVDWEQIAAHSRLDTVRGLVGWEGCPYKIHTGCDGTFAPEPFPIQVSFWLYDRSAGRFYTPETLATEWKLDDNRLPISVVTWKKDDVEVSTTTFSRWFGDARQLVTFCRTVVKNLGGAPKDLEGYIVVRPSVLARAKGNKDCREIEYDGKSAIRVDGKLAAVVRCGEAAPSAGEPLTWAGVAPLAGAGKTTGGEDGARAAVVIPARADAGKTATFDVAVASGDSPADETWLVQLDGDSSLEAVRSFWRERVPMQLSLPDRKYADFFYSSLYYILIMETGTELRPGPYNYTCFFLHDSVEMVEALDKAGLASVAREALGHFQFHAGDGYLDAIGGCAYALYAHYRLTDDTNYLNEVYPRIVEHCRFVQSLRAKQLTGEFENSVAYGLLPLSVSQDNFKKPAHLYLDDWWALVGLKAGALAARAIGREDDAKWMTAEADGLRADILASIERVMKRDGLSTMPGFADAWPPADHVVDEEHRILGSTQIAWAQRPALVPGESLGLSVPRELFRKSYEHYWKDAGRFSGWNGGWYVEYETFFWGYNVLLARPLVFLGMKDEAIKSIEWSLANPSCPGGWSEAMHTRVNDRGMREVAEGIVGDVPHGWTAGHYVLLVRDMLLREDPDQLVLLSCVPDRWFEPGQVIEVRNARTFFGVFGMRVETDSKRQMRIALDAPKGPPGGYIVCLPRPEKIRAARVDGKEAAPAANGRLSVPVGTREIVVEYGG